jgi:hypothetical protein
MTVQTARHDFHAGRRLSLYETVAFEFPYKMRLTLPKFTILLTKEVADTGGNQLSDGDSGIRRDGPRTVPYFIRGHLYYLSPPSTSPLLDGLIISTTEKSGVSSQTRSTLPIR